MENDIYSLQFALTDRSHSYHPFILFLREDPLTENDFIPVEKKMLQRFPIPRMLPVQFIEMDSEISLRYQLGTKQTLAQCTTRASFQEEDGLQVLFAIASVIEDCKKYLLQEQRYLLDEQFIYIGADYMDVNLIYLPLRELPNKRSLQEELFRLAVHLMTRTNRPLSKNGKLLLQQMELQTFQMNDLKKMLTKCMVELPPEVIQTTVDTIEPKQKQVSKLARSFYDGLKCQFKNSLLIISMISLLILIWCVYFLFPLAGIFNVCLGITLLAVGVYPWANQKVVQMETSELISSSITEENYYEQLAEQTVLLNPPAIAALELSQGESVEKINIYGKSFVIGRNNTETQYVLDYTGVSRKHLEISHDGNEYAVKDLGSRNGSYLNDELMIPHKLYALIAGDRIKIVESEFIYKKFV